MIHPMTSLWAFDSVLTGIGGDHNRTHCVSRGVLSDYKYYEIRWSFIVLHSASISNSSHPYMSNNPDAVSDERVTDNKSLTDTK